MRTFLLVWLAGCGTRTPLGGADSDADGDADVDADTDADTDADATSCTEVCDRVFECDLEGGDFCEDDCDQIRRALTPEAFETIYGDCIHEPCDEIEECAEEAPQEVEPQPFHRDACADACDRIDACNLEDGGDPCMADCLEGEGEFPIPTVSRAVIDDLYVCLDGSCDELEECVEAVFAQWFPEN